MKAEGIRRGAGHVRQLTILGDGAAWIWNIATDKFPEATQIVDLFHAREHLHDLARQLEFMLLDHKQEWLEARLEDLDYGDIDAICRQARVFPSKAPRKTSWTPPWATSSTTRPGCATSGSGPAACSSAPCRRVRLQGGHRPAPQALREGWTVAGADAITTLRCQQASRPEDRIWRARHNQNPRLTGHTC